MNPRVNWPCKMSLEHAPGEKPLVCIGLKCRMRKVCRCLSLRRNDNAPLFVYTKCGFVIFLGPVEKITPVSAGEPTRISSSHKQLQVS